MITSEGRPIFLAIDPIDIRTGADGLAQRIQHHFNGTPCDGNIYAFRNKTSTRIKVLCFDGTGVWSAVRRLHKGRFIWPQSESQQIELPAELWHWLTLGVDWQRVRATTHSEWRV